MSIKIAFSTEEKKEHKKGLESLNKPIKFKEDEKNR